MLAVCYSTYGSPTSLALREIPSPTPGPGEVLVEVHAAALHIADSFAVRGAPWIMRLYTGLLRPKFGVPGFDLAGIVKSTGPGVWRFQPGDPVFGIGQGTCAEEAIASESALAPLPPSLSFSEAAALPTSGLAALHALRDAAKLHPGQELLIIGAAGGIGSYALQMASAMGAHVTGVCGPANLEYIRSLGAHQAIDYTTQDFAHPPAQYDVILDNVENRPLADCRRALRSRGTLLLNSGTGATGMPFLVRLCKPLLLAPFARPQRLRRYLSNPNASDLATLSEMVWSGTLRPTISRRYPLAETADALAHIETGHAQGKVVIEIKSDSPSVKHEQDAYASIAV